MKQVSVMILAGGASSRMGRNKAFLPVGGISILQRIVAVARTLSDDVLLIANDAPAYEHFQLPIVPDVRPNYGPLMGLYSGLLAARHELAVLLACDMPFVSASLLRYMIEQAPGYDIVIPRTADGLHPLHAVYRRSSCLPAIEQAIARGQRRMIAFYDQVQLRELSHAELAECDAQGVALMNVNTPDELAAAQRIAATYDPPQLP